MVTDVKEAFRLFVRGIRVSGVNISNLPKSIKLALFEECFKFSSKYKEHILHVKIHDAIDMHPVKIMHVNLRKNTFTYGKETKKRKFVENNGDIFVDAFLNHCRKYGFPMGNEQTFGRNEDYKIGVYEECSKTSCGLSNKKLVFKIKIKKDGIYRDTGVHLDYIKQRSGKRNRKLIENLYFKKHIKNAKIISEVLHMNLRSVQRIITEMKKEREL